MCVSFRLSFYNAREIVWEGVEWQIIPRGWFWKVNAIVCKENELDDNASLQHFWFSLRHSAWEMRFLLFVGIPNRIRQCVRTLNKLIGWWIWIDDAANGEQMERLRADFLVGTPFRSCWRPIISWAGQYSEIKGRLITAHRDQKRENNK